MPLALRAATKEEVPELERSRGNDALGKASNFPFNRLAVMKLFGISDGYCHCKAESAMHVVNGVSGGETGRCVAAVRKEREADALVVAVLNEVQATLSVVGKQMNVTTPRPMQIGDTLRVRLSADMISVLAFLSSSPASDVSQAETPIQHTAETEQQTRFVNAGVIPQQLSHAIVQQ